MPEQPTVVTDEMVSAAVAAYGGASHPAMRRALEAAFAVPHPDTVWKWEYSPDDSPDGTVHGWFRRLVSPWLRELNDAELEQIATSSGDKTAGWRALFTAGAGPNIAVLSDDDLERIFWREYSASIQAAPKRGGSTSAAEAKLAAWRAMFTAGQIQAVQANATQD